MYTARKPFPKSSSRPGRPDSSRPRTGGFARKGPERGRGDRQVSPAQPLNTSWDKVAPWYDEHINSDNHHKQVVLPNTLRLINKYFPQKLHTLDVLDIACGQGILAEKLFKERKLSYVGIDTADSLLEIARKQENAQIKFIRADAQDFISQPEIAAKKFNLAVSILALQNIEDLHKVFKQTSQVLDKDGVFIFVLTHPAFRVPKHSDWGEEHNSPIMFRKVDLYMTPTKIPIQSKPFKSKLNNEPSETTWTFHRSIEDYVKGLASAGFALIDLEEWNSHKVSEDSNPKARMENRARQEIPMFMCMVARKV